MTIPQEHLSIIRAKMLLIAHHQEIINKLHDDATEIIHQYVDDASLNYDLDLETGELTNHDTAAE